MRRLAVLATLCFALTPAVAQASSASRDGGILRYHAAGGEQNALTLRVEPVATGGDQIRMTDPGASVAVGANCQSIDVHTVICPDAASVRGVDIDLGDEDDSYSGSGAPEGFGTPGAGPIQGGPGNDRISFAPDDFESHSGFVNGDADGGPGNDVLTGTTGRNTFDGGPGDDLIRGGGGDDRLRGGDGRDELQSGPGADRVNGGGGNDRLFLSGPDFAVGGPGDDKIVEQGRQASTIVCGTGSDTVFGLPRSLPELGPWLSRTCELYFVSDESTKKGRIHPPWPVAASRAGRLVFRIPCTQRVCRGRLSIRSDRAPFRRLATRRIEIRHATKVALSLPRSVVHRARARRTRLRARLALPGELEAVVSWRFGLRL